MITEDLGGTLRRLRFAAGLSLEQVAARSGYQRDTIGRWERGTATPIVTGLADVLAVYGKRVDFVNLDAPAADLGPDLRRVPLADQHRLALRARRKCLGITQQQVADALGVATRTFLTWETGQTPPAASHAQAWEAFLAQKEAGAA